MCVCFIQSITHKLEICLTRKIKYKARGQWKNKLNSKFHLHYCRQLLVKCDFEQNTWLRVRGPKTNRGACWWHSSTVSACLVTQCLLATQLHCECLFGDTVLAGDTAPLQSACLVTQCHGQQQAKHCDRTTQHTVSYGVSLTKGKTYINRLATKNVSC